MDNWINFIIGFIIENLLDFDLDFLYNFRDVSNFVYLKKKKAIRRYIIHEDDIPAEEEISREGPRFPCTHEHSRRPQGFICETRKG